MSLITRNETTFSVNTASTYFLTTVIGNGQAGNSAFTDASGNQQSADENAPLGTGASLKNTSLKVVSEVMQVNPDKLGMIVTYYITDHQITNLDDETEVCHATTDAEENETVMFITTINFV